MLFLGLYLGRDIWRVDQGERVASIVSCEGYEEGFLREIGFKNREDCAQIRFALHGQYVDSCLGKIKLSNRESFDRALLDSCVYHLLEAEESSLSSEYMAYMEKK